MRLPPSPVASVAKVPFYIDGTDRSGELDSPEDFARLGSWETSARRLAAASVENPE
jgi:hypothetical protein